MQRIKALELHQLDDDLKTIAAEAEAQTGSSASVRTQAHHPGVVRALHAFRTALAKEAMLDAPLKELVRLRIARLNACQY